MASLNESATDSKINRKTFSGIIVSAKTEKTVLVIVETQRPDKKYKKIVRRRKKFMAHNENMECAEGDTVLIQECAPKSKRKTFEVKAILKKKGDVK